MKCFYCGQPLDFLNMHVDHILPKSLADDPSNLEARLRQNGVIDNYPNFSLDSLSNMVPSHGASCNLRKSNIVFPKAATLFYLSISHERLPRVLVELERLNTIAERGEVLAKLGLMLEKGDISDTEISEIVAEWEFRSIIDEPLVVTYGLNFPETMEMRGLKIAEQSAYAVACDRFESELVDEIRSVTDHSFHYAEASARNGETLSVRLVFPTIDLADIDVIPLRDISSIMPWWELLEVTSFYQVYGMKYRDLIDLSDIQHDQ